MNLNMYIPFRDATIIYAGKEIPVLGISEFRIAIDMLEAHYTVWVNTSDGQSIANINSTVQGVINMTPCDGLDVDARIRIDDFTIPCKIKKYAYNHVKHAYGVSIFFILNRDKVRTYIYDKDDNSDEEQTRFDILDLRHGDR